MSIGSFIPLLAQDSVAVEAQIALFFQQLLSPTGIAVALAGGGVLIAALVFRKVLPVTAGIAMASVTFQLHPDAITLNVLLGPLQAFRYSSKSIAFGLLVIGVVAVLGMNLPRRGRSVGFAASAFLAFQLYYIVQVLVFSDFGLLRGVFGLVSVTLMFLVYAVGFGRRFDGPHGARDALSIFAWVGAAFVTVNLVQIALGRSGAFVGGRLAGICGNAQMMGGVTTMLLLGNAYLAADLPRGRPAWVVSVVNSGLLALLIVATGSRTAVLGSSVGLMFIFRRQIGRAILLAVPVVIVFFAASAYLEETGDAVSRMIDAPNTRAGVWSKALSQFMGSPVFGILPFGGEDGEQSGVESTLLRSLASLGLIGGIVVLLPFAAMVANCVHANWLGRADPDYRRICDFYVGSSLAIIVFNTFDGYGFGLLTFPVVFMYLNFSLGDFLAAEARAPAEEELAGAEPSTDAWAT